MNASPLVSICIPAHDDARVLADAIGSARAQDWAPLEIVVLDNASTDASGEVARRAAGDDPRLRCLRHPRDIGMAGNFSAGIAAARGALVLVLCADDALEAGAARALAEALQAHPRAVLAACGRIECDEALRPRRVVRARARPQEVEGTRLMRECFAWGNRIGEPSAVMFRRAAAARGFSPEYSQLLDLEMWFHLLAAGPAVLLPQALCRVRRHRGQATAANIRSARLLEDKQRFFRQFAPALAPSLSRAERLAWDARMASSVARVRRAGGAVAGLPLAEVFHPRLFRTLLAPGAALLGYARGA